MANAGSWIYTTLSNDGTLAGLISSRIYRDQAPEGVTFPLIVFQEVSAVPVTNAFADILMNGEVWQIKAVDKSRSNASVNTIAAQIRAVLHKARGSNVVSCVLEMESPQTEMDDVGDMYKSIILDFRVHTQ